MTIDLNIIGTIASIVSLVLAVVFWLLASRQAEKADSILNEVKDNMMSWQSEINKAAINFIQARPEVVEEKVSLEEAKNNSKFMNRIADIIKKFITEADEKTQAIRLLSRTLFLSIKNHQLWQESK